MYGLYEADYSSAISCDTGNRRRQTPLLTGMNKKTLDLWCAYLDDLLCEEVAQSCAALLSEEERARAERFRFSRHRREALASRALVRIALSHYYPLPPEAWQFTVNAHGKPSADPDCSLRFNLSNTVGLVVCLIAEGSEVGVDAEPHARAKKILELAPKAFSAYEQAQLEDLHGAEKQDRALSLWTLKEAYIKARGNGCEIDLCRRKRPAGRNGSSRVFHPFACLHRSGI